MASHGKVWIDKRAMDDSSHIEGKLVGWNLWDLGDLWSRLENLEMSLLDFVLPFSLEESTQEPHPRRCPPYTQRKGASLSLKTHGHEKFCKDQLTQLPFSMTIFIHGPFASLYLPMTGYIFIKTITKYSGLPVSLGVSLWRFPLCVWLVFFSSCLLLLIHHW